MLTGFLNLLFLPKIIGREEGGGQAGGSDFVVCEKRDLIMIYREIIFVEGGNKNYLDQRFFP